MVGELVCARLLAHAGSLLNLAKEDVRLPLVKITESTKKEVRKAMKFAGLIS